MTNQIIYDYDFYKSRDFDTRYAAKRIIDIVNKIKKISSVLDLGCGNGVWLSELEKIGVPNTVGVDGAWVPKDLFLSRGKFIEHDFSQDFFEIKEKFDLVITLEMFEHIDLNKAKHLIEQISKITNLVLFSAALPFQGGKGHVNEQSLSFWQKEFAKYGFNMLDILRPEIWGDDKIPYWYRQNTVLFSSTIGEKINTPVDIVHPETLAEKMEPSIRRAIQYLFYSLKQKIKRS